MKIPSSTVVSAQEYAGLVEAVRAASELLLQLWPGTGNAERSDLKIQQKEDGSLVSRADHGSNELLCDALRKLFPRDEVISEEVEDLSLVSQVSSDSGSGRVWIIDPLDGTKSFLEGRDDFSILVALCINADPVFGMMHFPARQIEVVARVGEGCCINGKWSAVSSNETCRKGHVYFRNFTSTRPDLSAGYMDSGLALMQVASGELDGAVIRMTHHKEWDIAAPMAAIIAAGGRVSDETGASLSLGRKGALPNYFLASNGRECHLELLRSIKPN
jgi:3'-phosphoadenosine 5'-phosphosulfate (PAPS) 3'-phosphatase